MSHYPNDLRHCYLDTETAGLVAKTDGLCSIGIVDPEGNTFYTLIQPVDGLNYKEEAFKVNGLSLEKLQKEGIPEETAIHAAMGFLDHNCRSSYITGANIKFDLGFLEAAAERVGISPDIIKDHRRTCEIQTMALTAHEMGMITLPAAKNNPDMARISLDAILASVGIEPRNGPHDALDDAQLTKTVYLEIRKRMNEAIYGKPSEDGRSISQEMELDGKSSGVIPRGVAAGLVR